MTKLHAELVALADYALTSEDKKLSVIGIFDKVFVKAVPANHPRMSFVVTLTGEAHTREDLKMRVVTPSGKEVFKTDIKISLGENGKANLVSNFEGFPLSEIGVFQFVIEKESKTIVSYDLDVIQVKDQDGKHVAN